MVPEIEFYPKMPRKKSKAVPEGNSPVLHDTSGLLGGVTLEEIRRIMSKALDKSFDNFYGLKPGNSKEMRATHQGLAGLDHHARQSRLATKADIPPEKKTRKRKENAAADQAKHGDSCSAKKVDPNPMRLTSFSDDSIKPPAFPCRDDAKIGKGAAAPKPCLSPEEMHTPTAAGGLLPVGTASTAIRTIFPPTTFFSWSLDEETKKRSSRTKNQLVRRRVVCDLFAFCSHIFWTSSSLDVPAGVTQEEGHT